MPKLTKLIVDKHCTVTTITQLMTNNIFINQADNIYFDSDLVWQMHLIIINKIRVVYASNF